MKPAEMLMEIAVFFVRAVFIIAVVLVLITARPLPRKRFFPASPKRLSTLAPKRCGAGERRMALSRYRVVFFTWITNSPVFKFYVMALP